MLLAHRVRQVQEVHPLLQAVQVHQELRGQVRAEHQVQMLQAELQVQTEHQVLQVRRVVLGYREHREHQVLRVHQVLLAQMVKQMVLQEFREALEQAGILVHRVHQVLRVVTDLL